MEPDDAAFCLDRTAQHSWGEIINWTNEHHDIPAVKQLAKSYGKILKTTDFARIGPVEFMKMASGIVGHISASDHFVMFCVVRIVQEYCAGNNTSAVIEPFVISFLEQLLFYLRKDHPAEDIKNIFGSASDVISWLLRARPHRLEAYLVFLVEVVCSAETPLEVGRAVLSFVNQRLEMLARDQRSAMRCSLQPQLPGLLQLLHGCGDYDVQAMVVECFFRLTTHRERPALAAQWLPTEELQRAFVALLNFDPDCRVFLNALNQRQGALRRVHSFPAESVLLSEYRLQKPSDPAYRHLWVDFNEGSGVVMLYCQRPVTDTQADDSLWATVMIYRRDVLRARLQLEARTQTLRLTLSCSCRDLLSSAALDDCSGNAVTMVFTKEQSLHSVLGRLYGNAYKFQACELLGSGRQKCSEGIQAVPCRPAAAFSATASASVGTAKASVAVSGISVSRSTSAPVVAAAETPGRRSDVPKSSVVSAPQRVSGAGRGRSPVARYRQLEMSSPEAELRRPEVTGTPAESEPVSQSSAASVIQPSQSQTVAPSTLRTPSASSKPITPRFDALPVSKLSSSQMLSEQAAGPPESTGREAGRSTQEQLLASGDEDGVFDDMAEREPAWQDAVSDDEDDAGSLVEAHQLQSQRQKQSESGVVLDLVSSQSDEEQPPPGQSRNTLSSQQEPPPPGQSRGTLSSQQEPPPPGQSRSTLSSQQEPPPPGQSRGTLSSQQEPPSPGQPRGTLSSQQEQLPPGQSRGTLSSQQEQLPPGQSRGTLSSQQEPPPPGQPRGTLSSQQEPPSPTNHADAEVTPRQSNLPATTLNRQNTERSTAQLQGRDIDAPATRRRRCRPQYCELSSPDGQGAGGVALAAHSEPVIEPDLNNNLSQESAPRPAPRDSQWAEFNRRGGSRRPADQPGQKTGASTSKKGMAEKKPKSSAKARAGCKEPVVAPKKAKKQRGKKANVSTSRITFSSPTESPRFGSGQHHTVYSEIEMESSGPRRFFRKRALASRSPRIFSDIGASTASDTQPDPPDTKRGVGTFKRHPAGDPTRLRNRQLLTQSPPPHHTEPPCTRGRNDPARKGDCAALAEPGTWTSRVRRSPLRSPERLRDEPAPQTSERAGAELVVSPQAKRRRKVAPAALASEWSWESLEGEAAPSPASQQTAELQLEVVADTDGADPTAAGAAEAQLAPAAADISVSLRESAPSVLCPPNTPAAAGASVPRLLRPPSALPPDSPPRDSRSPTQPGTQEFLLDARASDAEPPGADEEDAAEAIAIAALVSVKTAAPSLPEEVVTGPGGSDNLLETIAAVRREVAHLDRQDSDLLQLQRRSAAALEVLLQQQTAALTTLQQLSAAAATARQRAAERVLAECQRLESAAAAAADLPAQLPLVPAQGLGELADIRRELLQLQRGLQ